MSADGTTGKVVLKECGTHIIFGRIGNPTPAWMSIVQRLIEAGSVQEVLPGVYDYRGGNPDMIRNLPNFVR